MTSIAQASSTSHANADSAVAVAAAIDGLGMLVSSQRGGDETYFRNQLPRYARTLHRIQALRPAPCSRSRKVTSQVGTRATGMLRASPHIRYGEKLWAHAVVLPLQAEACVGRRTSPARLQ